MLEPGLNTILMECRRFIYGCFRKWWYPQIIHFKEFSIIHHPFWGTPIFGNIHTMFGSYSRKHPTNKTGPWPMCDSLQVPIKRKSLNCDAGIGGGLLSSWGFPVNLDVFVGMDPMEWNSCHGVCIWSSDIFPCKLCSKYPTTDPCIVLYIYLYTFNHQHQANVGTYTSYTVHRSYEYICIFCMYHYIPDIDIDMVFQVAILVLIDIFPYIVYLFQPYNFSCFCC